MCRFVLAKCCEFEIRNSHCSVAEDSVFWHVTPCCWASGSMMSRYSGTSISISVYHQLFLMLTFLGLLDPEDEGTMGLQSVKKRLTQ
jgi:hypothetical protein